MNTNRTQFAILGMLTLEPMSGYDFRKVAEQCLGYFWQESYGQIYPTLKKMHEMGYLSRSREKTEGKPDRYVYFITKKGEEAFHKWLDQKTRIEPKRNELLLKLFFGGKTDLNKQIRELESIKETNEKLLADLHNLEDWHLKHYDHHALTPYWLVTIRFGIHRVSAMISWCQESIETLRTSQNETFSSVPDPVSFYFKSRKI